MLPLKLTFSRVLASKCFKGWEESWDKNKHLHQTHTMLFSTLSLAMILMKSDISSKDIIVWLMKVFTTMLGFFSILIGRKALRIFWKFNLRLIVSSVRSTIELSEMKKTIGNILNLRMKILKINQKNTNGDFKCNLYYFGFLFH